MSKLSTISDWQCDSCDKTTSAVGTNFPNGWGQVQMIYGHGWGRTNQYYIVCAQCKGLDFDGTLLPEKEHNGFLRKTFRRLFQRSLQ